MCESIRLFVLEQENVNKLLKDKKIRTETSCNVDKCGKMRYNMQCCIRSERGIYKVIPFNGSTTVTGEIG